MPSKKPAPGLKTKSPTRPTKKPTKKPTGLAAKLRRRSAVSKLLPHRHTGKLRPHRHTSYGSLLIVLVVACVPVLAANRAAAFGLPAVQGSYSTNAVVPAPIPKQPTITTPVSGQVLKGADPVTVQGGCSNHTMVEIFSNQVVIGAALCQGGSYQLGVALLRGQNTLVARSYNPNGTPGPDSAPVTLTYSFAAAASTGNPFYLTGTQEYLGAAVGQAMEWPIAVVGGQAPYAVSVNWGDGQSSLISRPSAGAFPIDHTYQQAPKNQAQYVIVVRATDQAGTVSYLQLVAIVSSLSVTPVITTTNDRSATQLLVTRSWQILLGSAVVVASFWGGEQLEAYRLKHHVRRLA